MRLALSLAPGLSIILTICSMVANSWGLPIANTVFVSRLKLTPAVVRAPKAPITALATMSGPAYCITKDFIVGVRPG